MIAGFRTLVIGIALLHATICAHAAQAVHDVCPVRVEVSRSGEFYTNRFQGHYKTSAKLLERDLRGGCYNDANPSKVTSVTAKVVPNAPPGSVQALYRLLEQNGWPKSKLKVGE
jgi:hypothetical protein